MAMTMATFFQLGWLFQMETTVIGKIGVGNSSLNVGLFHHGSSSRSIHFARCGHTLHLQQTFKVTLCKRRI